MHIDLKGGGGDDPKFLSLIKLRNAGRIIHLKPDGNCLFRGIAHSFYGDDGMHAKARKEIARWYEEMGEKYCYAKGYFNEPWTHMVTTR